MSTPETDQGIRDQRFNDVLAEYEIHRDQGQAIDRDAFIQEHLEFEQELRKHFEGVDAIQACVETQSRDVPTTTLAPGSRFGDYELIESLGRGGMGVVYKARQKSLGRIVALKMLRAYREENLDDVQRFFGEAEAAARLQHSHIVRIYEVGEDHGHPFFSMDLVEGQSLANAISQNPLPQRRAAEYLQKIAEAMQFAHDQGVVHRDLKPANVLIDQHDEPRITDFGLAKRVDCDSKLTATGVPMGTPSYMSPEQARGVWQEVGTHSDIYSLGATLYDLLVGRPPFSAATWSELLVQVLNHDPVSPRELNPAIHRDLETICLKCLQKKPSDRYASAQELADDLRRYLHAEPICARPISPVERTWRWCRRYPLAVAAIASLALGLCLAIAFYWKAEAARERADENFQKAETARQDAEAARQEAEANFRDARGAVDDLLTTVSNDTLLNQPGLQSLRRKLLERARDYYQGFRQRTSADLSTKLEDARIVHCLANINSELGEAAVASKLYGEACTVLAGLLLQSPEGPDILDAYSSALMDSGILLHRQNKLDEAASKYAEARKLRQQLKQILDTPTARSWLEQQLAAMRERLRFVDRLIANSAKNLGDVELDRWRKQTKETRTLAPWEKAREYMEKARKILAELASTVPEDPDVRHDLGQAEYTLGRLYEERGEDKGLEQEKRTSTLGDAVAHLEQAVRQFDTLLEQRDKEAGTPIHFDYLDAEFDRATALRVWGDTLSLTYKLLEDQPEQAKERHQQAKEKYRTAVKAFDALARGNPAVASYQLQTASARLNLLVLLLTQDYPKSDEEQVETRSDLDKFDSILNRVEEEYPKQSTLREECRELRKKLQGLLQIIEVPDSDRRVKNQVGPPFPACSTLHDDVESA